MEREIDMKEVSDGRLYGLRDMVKADCGGCQGCSDCCESMGSTIILDPYDVWRLTKGLKTSFDELLRDKLPHRHSGALAGDIGLPPYVVDQLGRVNRRHVIMRVILNAAAADKVKDYSAILSAGVGDVVPFRRLVLAEQVEGFGFLVA